MTWWTHPLCLKAPWKRGLSKIGVTWWSMSEATIFLVGTIFPRSPLTLWHNLIGTYQHEGTQAFPTRYLTSDRHAPSSIKPWITATPDSIRLPSTKNSGKAYNCSSFETAITVGTQATTQSSLEFAIGFSGSAAQWDGKTSSTNTDCIFHAEVGIAQLYEQSQKSNSRTEIWHWFERTGWNTETVTKFFRIWRRYKWRHSKDNSDR